MKKTNPVLAGLAAVALSAALVPALALATEGTNKTEDTTKVHYTVDKTYTWTVPADITFASNSDTDTQTGSVEVKNCVIDEGEALTISLGHDDGMFTLKSKQGATRTYKVEAGGSALSADQTVLKVPAGKLADKTELTFKLDSANGQTKAGTYEGTLSYVATVGAAN